jgi:hypothetical protein
MRDLEWKSLPFLEVKAEGDGSEFTGYCAAFNNVDSYGDVIVPGAFAKSLPDFLKNGQICFNHEEVIGKPLEAHEDAKGLFVKGRISDTAKGRDCKTLLKDGVMRKMSIGFKCMQRKRAVPNEITDYWKTLGYQPGPEDLSNMQANSDYLNFLHEIKLYEASPVGFPANTAADITGVKAMPLSRLKKLLKQVDAEVKSGRTLSRETHAYLSACHDAMAPALKDLKTLLDMHDPDAIAGQDDDEDEPEAGSNGGASKPNRNGGDTDESSNSKPKSASSTLLVKARAELALLSAYPSLSRISR